MNLNNHKLRMKRLPQSLGWNMVNNNGILKVANDCTKTSGPAPPLPSFSPCIGFHTHWHVLCLSIYLLLT